MAMFDSKGNPVPRKEEHRLKVGEELSRIGAVLKGVVTAKQAYKAQLAKISEFQAQNKDNGFYTPEYFDNQRAQAKQTYDWMAIWRSYKRRSANGTPRWTCKIRPGPMP